MAQTELPLKPIPIPDHPVEHTFTFSGPLRPTNPAQRGDCMIECPSCHAPFFVEVRPEFINTIGKVQCYKCRKWSIGALKVTSSTSSELDQSHTDRKL